MTPHWTNRLGLPIARLGTLLGAMVIVQVVTGTLLALWYVPSRNAATMLDGRMATVSSEQRIETIGNFIDTLGVHGQPTLVPARRGDAVPSQAAASVAVNIANAPAGEFLRNIHHNATGWLYTLSILWLVMLALSRAYRKDGPLWIRAVFVVILVLIGAWSGRLLPDDVYAEISRRIVGHELQEAPFGSFFATLFGADPSHPLLSRTFVMHALVGAALLSLLWKPLSAMRGAASAASGVSQDPGAASGVSQDPGAASVVSQDPGAASLKKAVGREWGFTLIAGLVAVVLGTAFNPIETSPLRDVVGGLSGQVHAEPWWVIRPLHTLVGWFGAELAGYLLIALTLTLLILPMRKRN